MTPNEYQEAALTTASYERLVTYPALGLIGEAGEVAEKVKKLHRDNSWNFADPIPEEHVKGIALELSDVCWYAAVLAHDLGFKLSDVTDFSIPWHAHNDLVENTSKLHYACSYASSMLLCGYFQESSIKNAIKVVFDNVGIMASIIGYTTEDICKMNIEKLASRKQRGVIHGNGDYR